MKRTIAFLTACTSLASMPAIAGPSSIEDVKRMMFSDVAMQGTERGCSQVAFEFDLTEHQCVSAEQEARTALLGMLDDSSASQRAYYWGMCAGANRFGGYGVEYMGALKCIQFTRAKCTPTPPHPQGNYAQCLRAIKHRAFYTWNE